MSLLPSTSIAQTPLINLLISLLFGAGQIAAGTGLIIYAVRRGRWRQMGFFGLAVIGALIACSGITEMIVSSTELLAQTGSLLTTATAGQIRGFADRTLSIAVVLVLLLASFYPALMRLWSRRRSATIPSIEPRTEEGRLDSDPSIQ